jgi:hypothetical protein
MAEDPRFPRLVLRCGDSFEAFTLSEDRKHWTKQFNSMVEALTCAENLHQGPVNLVVLDDAGTFITHYMLNPSPSP